MANSPWDRVLMACGVVGPAVFTTAWVVGTVRQPGYSISDEHISGLAAPDAQAPNVMRTGFMTLGACSVGFAVALDRRLGNGAGGSGVGPAFLAASGLAIGLAGMLRRDRLSNFAPPGTPQTPQSWVNDGHDLASVTAQVTGTVGLLALSRRLAQDPVLHDLSAPALRAALTSSGAMTWFARAVTRPGNGIVQRVGVSIPLAFMARTAVRLLREP
ncbi:MAG TPA: DUF998 domain-containing protein [Actinomycetota bacterium]